jgi:hypothetical protein
MKNNAHKSEESNGKGVTTTAGDRVSWPGRRSGGEAFSSGTDARWAGGLGRRFAVLSLGSAIWGLEMPQWLRRAGKDMFRPELLMHMTDLNSSKQKHRS